MKLASCCVGLIFSKLRKTRNCGELNQETPHPSNMIASVPSNNNIPPDDDDLGFVKHRHQSRQVSDKEYDAQMEEARLWIEHRAKCGFWQRRAEDKTLEATNKFEILYYCPRFRPGNGCVVMAYRNYKRLWHPTNDELAILGEEYQPCCCNCNTSAEKFLKCLPRKQYMDLYGEKSVMALKLRDKAK